MQGEQPEPTTEPGVCPECGQAVAIQRWDLSVVEHWGRALGKMGFLVVAPGGWPRDHPGMAYVNAAREDLFTLSESCEGCFGVGIADDWRGDWRNCPYCQGVGRVPMVSLSAIQAAHHRWFHEWPQFYRHSLLYGIADSGERGLPPRYDGPAITYLEDPAKQVVFGPVPYADIDVMGEQAWAFLPLSVARVRARTLQVVFNVTTWGDLRRGLVPAELHLLEDLPAIAFGEAPPGDHEAFSFEDVFPEGQPPPQQAAGDWFPITGSESFKGKTHFEVGLVDVYRERDVPAIVVHLENHGFTVIRDDLLVSAAYMPERVTDARQVAPDVGPHAEWPGWVVFHAPHTSTFVPLELRDAILLDDDELRHELDRLTDHHAGWLLIPDVRDADVVAPGVSRLVVDVERFLGDDQEPMARVGMGVIYTSTSHGRALRAPPAPDERRALLDSYYHPHHQRLEATLQAALDAYGRALILDLHAFPDVPLPCDLDQEPDRPDICIGTDAFHTPIELRDRIVAQLTDPTPARWCRCGISGATHASPAS
jgi:N-formylglutamate amidohydrolase